MIQLSDKAINRLAKAGLILSLISMTVSSVSLWNIYHAQVEHAPIIINTHAEGQVAEGATTDVPYDTLAVTVVCGTLGTYCAEPDTNMFKIHTGKDKSSYIECHITNQAELESCAVILASANPFEHTLVNRSGDVSGLACQTSPMDVMHFETYEGSYLLSSHPNEYWISCQDLNWVLERREMEKKSDNGIYPLTTQPGQSINLGKAEDSLVDEGTITPAFHLTLTVPDDQAVLPIVDINGKPLTDAESRIMFTIPYCNDLPAGPWVSPCIVTPVGIKQIAPDVFDSGPTQPIPVRDVYQGMSNMRMSDIPPKRLEKESEQPTVRP